MKLKVVEIQLVPPAIARGILGDDPGLGKGAVLMTKPDATPMFLRDDAAWHAFHSYTVEHLTRSCKDMEWPLPRPQPQSAMQWALFAMGQALPDVPKERLQEVADVAACAGQVCRG